MRQAHTTCLNLAAHACPTCGAENLPPELFEAPTQTTCEACGWDIRWERWSRTLKTGVRRTWHEEEDDETFVLTKPELVALRVYETQVSTQDLL